MIDLPTFWRARGQLVRAKLVPHTLALPSTAFWQVEAMIRPKHRLGGALVKLAARSDKCVLWGYDPKPGQERLVPFLLLEGFYVS